MKTTPAILKPLQTILILAVISGQGLGLMKMDKVRNNPRHAYERQLQKLARAYKGDNLDRVTGKVEADQPDMAALQEFFMTMDPALLRVPAERLPAAYSNMHNLQRNLHPINLPGQGLLQKWGENPCHHVGPQRSTGEKSMGRRGYRGLVV